MTLALVVTSFASACTYALCFPSLAPYLLELDPQAGQLLLGISVAIYSLTKALFAPIVGRVVGVVGTQAPLLALVVLLAASQVLYALASSAWLVVVSRAVMGAASTTSTVCRTAVAMNVASREERTRQTAAINAATTLGFVGGPAIGGLLFLIPGAGLNSPGWLGAGLAGLNLLLLLSPELWRGAAACWGSCWGSCWGRRAPPLLSLRPSVNGSSRRASLRASLRASVENSNLRTALAPGGDDRGSTRDELPVGKEEEAEAEAEAEAEEGQAEGWTEGGRGRDGTPPWEVQPPTAAGESESAVTRSASHAPAPASRTGLFMLGMVQLAMTSPFASFETLVTPFTEDAYAFSKPAIGALFAGASAATLPVNAAMPALMRHVSGRALLLGSAAATSASCFCTAARSKRPIGSARARPLCLLRARLAALGSSALPGRGPATGSPATASGSTPRGLKRAPSKGRSPIPPPLNI